MMSNLHLVAMFCFIVLLLDFRQEFDQVVENRGFVAQLKT